MSRRLLYLWFPNWPIQRLCRAESHHQEKPLLLAQRDARRGEIVAACCRRARNHGVRIQMSLAEATALIQHGRGPHIPSKSNATSPQQYAPPNSHGAVECLPYDPASDRETLKTLAQWCDQFSPTVGLAGTPEPDALQLEMTGLSQRQGGECPMLERIAGRLKQRGYFGHFALADTLGAARALALSGHELPKFGENPSPINPNSVARTATLCFNSSGMPIYIAQSGETRAAIGPLPITALELPESSLHLLLQLGIDRIEQLHALPRAGLATRFGPALLDALNFAFDETASIIETFRATPNFHASWQAEHPTDRRPIVAAAIQHLCQHLSELLLAHQQGALELECRLRYEQRELYEHDGLETEGASRHQYRFQVTLFQPTCDSQHLWQLMSHRFEQTELPGMVTEVVLQATSTSPRYRPQYSLWPTLNSFDPTPLADLIDRVSNRLGEDVIGAVRLRAAVLPENAYAFIPLSGPNASRARLSAGLNRQPPAAEQRPLQLFEPPIAISLDWGDDGQPVCLRSRRSTRPPTREASAQPRRNRTTKVPHLWQPQERQAIVEWQGPERIETRWWRGKAIRRDYYQAQCDTGARYWLFQNLNNQAWFLHGCF